MAAKIPPKKAVKKAKKSVKKIPRKTGTNMRNTGY